MIASGPAPAWLPDFMTIAVIESSLPPFLTITDFRRQRNAVQPNQRGA